MVTWICPQCTHSWGKKSSHIIHTQWRENAGLVILKTALVHFRTFCLILLFYIPMTWNLLWKEYLQLNILLIYYHVITVYFTCSSVQSLNSSSTWYHCLTAHLRKQCIQCLCWLCPLLINSFYCTKISKSTRKSLKKQHRCWSLLPHCSAFHWNMFLQKSYLASQTKIYIAVISSCKFHVLKKVKLSSSVNVQAK